MTEEIHKEYLPVQKRIFRILEMKDKQTSFADLAEVISDNEIAHQRVNEWIYRATRTTSEGGVQIATFLNVNREIYNANYLLVEALKYILLPIP